MADSVEQALVLDCVICILRVLELGDGFESGHRPVRQFPGLRPADVHVLSANYHHDYLEVIVPNRSAQTRPCVGRDSGLDSVYSPLA